MGNNSFLISIEWLIIESAELSIVMVYVHIDNERRVYKISRDGLATEVSQIVRIIGSEIGIDQSDCTQLNIGIK